MSYAFLVVSCASPITKGRLNETAYGKIIWPGAPEKPRIKYLWSLSDLNAEEVERGGGLLDMISGSSIEDLTDPRYAPFLLRPQGIYVDDKRYYIADAGGSRVTVIDRNSLDVMQITGAGDKDLVTPVSVVSSSDGRIYVSDADSRMIASYDAGGRFLFIFEGELQRPSGLAIDRKRGIIYAVDTLGHCIYKYGLDGKLTGKIGRRGEGNGEFNYPTYATVDENGMLYVTDFLNFRVQFFSLDGRFAGLFGVLGDSYDNLDKPKGIAVDRGGHIFVVDSAKQRDTVKIFDRNGKLLLFFGETGHDFGQFYLPTGITIDAQDIIYVADTVNGRIQAFQFLGGD